MNGHAARVTTNSSGVSGASVRHCEWFGGAVAIGTGPDAVTTRPSGTIARTIQTQEKPMVGVGWIGAIIIGGIAGWLGYLIAGFVGACILIAIARAIRR